MNWMYNYRASSRYTGKNRATDEVRIMTPEAAQIFAEIDLDESTVVSVRSVVNSAALEGFEATPDEVYTLFDIVTGSVDAEEAIAASILRFSRPRD